MIHVCYFSNQFASFNGHGIARYAHHLYKALLQNNTWENCKNKGENIILRLTNKTIL
jgi:hypothetical protein